jgi:uncharacterized protein YlzI (FlbEa/FlbD family)
MSAAFIFAADATETPAVPAEYLVGEDFDLSAYPAGATVSGFNSTSPNKGEAVVSSQSGTITVPYTVVQFQPSVGTIKKGAPFVYSIVAINYNKQSMAVVEGVDFNVYGDTDTFTTGNKKVTFEYKGRFFVCDYEVTDRALSNIAQVPGSFKSRYYQGELVDTTGAKMRLVWADSEVTTYNVMPQDISGFTTSVTGVQEMTVTVLDKTAKVPYVVEVGILDVSIQYNGLQVDYKLNEAFKQFSCFVTYTDLRTTTITIDAGAVQGFDTKTLGTRTLTFTVGNITKTLTYTVIPEIQAISVQSGTLATEYGLNSNLNLENAQLKLSYKGGTFDVIPIYDYMITGFSTEKEGSANMTIKYENFQTSFAYKVVDYTKPVLNVYFDEYLYHTDRVVVEVTAGGHYRYIVLPNGSRTTSSSYNYTIRENGNYTFKLVPTDASLTTIEETITVDTIDNDAPEVKITLKEGKIYVSANDKQSGVNKIVLQSGRTIYYGDSNKEEIAPNQNGTITVTDEAGNQTQYSIYIYGGITFAYERYDPTSVDLMGSNIAEILYNEQKIELTGTYSVKTVNLTSTPHTFAWGNYRYTIGGTGYTAVADTTAPVITFTQEGSYIRWMVTDANTIATVTINNTVTTLRTGLLENKQGTSYYVYAKDAAGNESSRMWTYGDSYTSNGNSDSSYVTPNLTNRFNVKVKTVSGYIQGYDGNVFKPDSPVTKAEILTMLGRVLDVTSGAYPKSGTDVQKTEWLNKASANIEAYGKKLKSEADAYAAWFSGDTTKFSGATVGSVKLPAANDSSFASAFDTIKAQWYFDSWSTVGASGVLTDYFVTSNGANQAKYFDTQINSYANRKWLANILYAVVDTSSPYYNKTFSDTQDTTITAVANAGILNGYPDGTFKPNANITRAEVVTMINHMMGQYLTSNAASVTFTDIADHWAIDEIKKASL